MNTVPPFRIRQTRAWSLGLIAVLIATSAILAGSRLEADETIVLKPVGTAAVAHVRAEVLDYTGAFLTVRHPSGREEKIPATRVQEVFTTWPAAYEEAAAAFAAQQYSQALTQYRAAMRAESRMWAKRHLLAQIILCLKYTEQLESACDAFLALADSDPDLLHFEVIPLTWITLQPSPTLRRKARDWIKDERAVARLLGASWLLSAPERKEAIDCLRSFTAVDPRLLFLAEAQLWRTEAATVTTDQVTHWETRISQMPPSIRGGPYYLLGQALSRLNRGSDAALAYLRVPLQHHEERQLASAALLAAGTELEKIQQTSAARRLYHELLDRYADTPAAATASERITSAAQP